MGSRQFGKALTSPPRSIRGRIEAAVKFKYAVSVLLLTVCTPGCAESYFGLASESRLPKWFTVPTGLTRADVTVSMAYYVGPSGRSATFKLWDSHGRKLAQISASQSDLEPHTFGPKSPHSGFDDRSYPLYEIITAKGITEVIEHRQMKPEFYITDDANVKAKLGLPSSN
jgi:hypothetical protein